MFGSSLTCACFGKPIAAVICAVKRCRLPIYDLKVHLQDAHVNDIDRLPFPAGYRVDSEDEA